MDNSAFKKEFLNRFGGAYHDFGFPALMGRVVGLLIYHEEPLSLQDITRELGVSKGPVSQILKRLRDHDLVQRHWKDGDRKDYYEAVDHIFLQAFTNHAKLLRRNLDLAEEFKALSAEQDEVPQHFQEQLEEMHAFNTRLQEALWEFIDSWKEENGSGRKTSKRVKGSKQ